jgi:hypothetical protein
MSPDQLAEIRARRARVDWPPSLALIPDWQALRFRDVRAKEFIAHAPEDIDALLATVARLQNLVAALIEEGAE